MTDNPRMQQLLDELLDSQATPEDVCRSCPELLPALRARWRQMCRVRAELDALFPTPPEPGENEPSLPQEGTALPRISGYEVEAVLGRGGMGVVFRARHLRLNRVVALKMALAGAYSGPHERERFQREAEAVAGLQHANVVQIYDVGSSDGRPYFTMEFVEGGSLAQKLTGMPQPAHQAAALLATLAGAVQAAHQGGIVHRDLKPANVLLTADGTPKISDFGLARRLEGEASITRTGTAVGTPSYMAPEQARGKTDAVGAAADIYALGAILYELLTGWPPFRAETAAETVQQVISQDPVVPTRRNAKVPRDLETICLKCLHKEPRLRYATAAALAQDLDRYLHGEAIAARPERRWERLVRRIRRRPVLSAALAAATLFTVALVGGGLWLISERAATAREVDAEKAATAREVEAERAATERAAAEDLREMVQWLKKSSWPEARTALERAKGRLGDRGSAELRRLLDQGTRALELAAQLDAIRLHGSGSAVGLARSSEKYLEAFRGAGLGQIDDPPEIVAARIKASHIRNVLLDALDFWSECAKDPRRMDWILEVARQADPDPTGWRVRARHPDIRKDDVALAQLIATAPIADPSVALLLALEHHLKPSNPERVPFLKRIQQAHPGDFWVKLRLGTVLLKMGKPSEAVGYYQAALAVRPREAIVWNNLGVALGVTGRKEEALEQHRQAVLFDPTASHYYNLALALWHLHRYDEAEAPLRRAVALEPQDTEAQSSLRTVLKRLGRVEEARLAWKTALEANPPEHDAWYGYAEFCLYLGHEEEYRRARQALLAKFGTSTDPYIAERTARACLLLPVSGDELRQAVALAERAAAVEPLKYSLGYAHFLFVQGLAKYRQGRLERAISAMRGDAARVLGPAPRLVLAMALHQNGQVAEARKTLAAAIKAYDWGVSQVRDQDGWICHVLRREAEGMILPNQSSSASGPLGHVEVFGGVSAEVGLQERCRFGHRNPHVG
jgi:Flp pilus assembly protein TadD